MSTRLIIEGNDVYEIDEECESCKKKHMKKPENKGKPFVKGNVQQQDRKKAP